MNKISHPILYPFSQTTCGGSRIKCSAKCLSNILEIYHFPHATCHGEAGLARQTASRLAAVNLEPFKPRTAQWRRVARRGTQWLSALRTRQRDKFENAGSEKGLPKRVPGPLCSTRYLAPDIVHVYLCRGRNNSTKQFKEFLSKIHTKKKSLKIQNKIF